MRTASIHQIALLATPRRRAALAVLVVVLLAHGLGLGLLPQAPGPGWQPDAMRPLRVRQIPPAAVTATAALPAVLLPGPSALTEMTPSALSPASPARKPPTRPVVASSVAPVVALAVAPRVASADAVPVAAVPGAPARASATTTVATALAVAPAPVSTTATAGADSAVALADPIADPDPVPDAGGLHVPVYATRLPPPVTLRYLLRRGPANGVAELRWSPSAVGYQLALDGDLPRQRVIAWASNGTVDGHGIAPERYVESRRGRELRAANFQRDAGRITFSGPQLQHPLLPGAQDRLSWLLQLPAVLAANPALAEPGAQVAMLVAGSRGSADVWTFAVIGSETVALPDGDSVNGTIHLRREPQRPYDTLVDVWLDPARHHLPVRLQLRLRAGGDGTELLLQQQLPQPQHQGGARP